MIHSEPLTGAPPAMPGSFLSGAYRRLLENRLSALREGVVEVRDGDRLRRFGTPADPALAIAARPRHGYRHR